MEVISLGRSGGSGGRSGGGSFGGSRGGGILFQASPPQQQHAGGDGR